MNSTTDPEIRSFLEVAPDADFPIQNLPYGIFSVSGQSPRAGVAIGDCVLDLAAIADAGLLRGQALGYGQCFRQATLNQFMAMGKKAWQEARAAISKLLRHDEPTLRDNRDLRDRALVARKDVTMHMPAEIRDYTDFYSSKEHATNVGSMFRGKGNALMPNWVHLPVAYHGRASSIVLSGAPIQRPRGQVLPEGAQTPIFRPARSLDFELEMGYFIGPGNKLGTPISVNAAPDHVFGMVLVNDWSARDVQKWEYQPLGPFLSKSFATSISPWVVTTAALNSFRVAGPKQEPPPLEYLQVQGDWAYDIDLEVHLQTERMSWPVRICRSNNKYLYWNICQQIAHHTVNGCNLRPGDLLATGTISGPTPDTYGSMLELAWRGEQPLQLPGGDSRVFLQDGDRLAMSGWCQGSGYRIGFGEVTAQILPAGE